MIITKGMKEINGYIEYSYRPDEATICNEGITEDDLDCMYESDTFTTLAELTQKMEPAVLEKIKNDYHAEKVWISCISFKGKSEDGETTADISMYDSKNGGHVATEIKNEDITDRAMLNMKKIKQIVDNTLEQYPIKY